MRFLCGIVLLLLISNLALAEKFELKVNHWMVPNGLPNNQILGIGQDADGFICIETQSGFYRFDGTDAYLINRQYNTEEKDSEGHITIKDGNLTVGGDLITGVFNSFIKTKNGTYWASSEEGLGIINTEEKKFQKAGKLQDMPISECNYLTESPDGKIWFSMPLNGIGFWDTVSNQLITQNNIKEYPHFKNAYPVFLELIDRYITSLFFDRTGNLWIGTENDGLFKISFEPERFQFFRYGDIEGSGLVHKDISFPLATKSGDIWISTWGGGINIWKKEELGKTAPKFDRIPVLLNNGKSIPERRIFPLLEDSETNIWFGTYGGGLYFLRNSDRERKIYNYQVFNKENGHLGSDTVTSVTEGLNNDLWCGTYSGITHIDQNLQTRRYFPELTDLSFFADKKISMVKKAVSGSLWIATRNEVVYRWDLKTNLIEEFGEANGNPLGIVFNYARINKIEWFVGSRGVFYYDESSNKFFPYKKNSAINAAESILVDHKGMLWVGTNNGLIKIDPHTNNLKYFDLPGGIMGRNFTQGASKDDKGYLYFGSRFGLYRFHPDNIEYEPPVAPIVFKQVNITGKEYSVDSLQNSNKWKVSGDFNDGYLNLSNKQNTIAVEYTSLYYNPDKVVVYEVMLEGNDAGWVETTDMNRSWSSLPAGNYIFKIREKGKGNMKQFPFVVQLPFWRKTQAVIFYIVVLGLTIFTVYRLQLSRIKKSEEKRQKERYDHLRFRFFLNVSHEIRTPLTLIKGAIDRLQDKSKDEKELTRIKRNTDRLITIVNEVLDFKKLEKTNIEVKNQYFDLKRFIESTVDAFRLREDKCKVNLKIPSHPVWIESSKELIETILYNLLSNAIKFSHEGGKVDVSLAVTDEACKISVQDYGVGIAEEEQSLIFDRFYQVPENNNYGAGIGLSLVKEFATRLNGKILLESELGKGSVFCLVLPFDAQRTEIENRDTEPENEVIRNKPILLVVDDQDEIRSFMKEIFEETFHCVEAVNGQQAWDLIKKHHPEIVISDVMMPVMNGFELCEQLRSDIETSHIPLVLLTAKTGEEAEIKAVSCNADAFISKPFSEKILKLRIEKLIEQRQLLKEKYLKHPDQDTNGLVSNKIDSGFMKMLEEEIHKELDNTEFNVDSLAKAVSLSPSGLYRKLKSISGQNPVGFIRTFRLKNAARLLRETNSPVTEIADLTGFGTQKYFSRCFKEQFGISPLKYRNS